MCPKETELEDPKDLRAEIGKFPNSTNERKQMSTKTMKQRIALVAVTALTAGVLSVVSAPASNAAVTFIAQTSNGIAPVVTLGSTKSVGVLAIDSTTPLAGTGVMLSTGAFALTSTADGAGYQAVKVTGGVITQAAAETTATAWTLNSTSTYIYGTGDDKDLAVIITPTAAAGSTMVVQAYTNAAASTVSGALLAQWTITIASSSVAGVMALANSTVAFTAADGDAATADVANANKATTGNGLFLNIQLKDAYGAALTSTAGALVATVSSGATIAVSANNGAVSTAGTGTTAVSSAAPGDLNLLVKETTAGTGWSGSVTVTYNGTTIATKTGTISGAASKITITPVLVGKNNGAATAASLEYQVQDAAGNNVVLPFANLVFSSSSNAAVVTTGAGSVVNTTSAAGNATFTCASSATGTSDLVLQTTLSNGTVVKSNSATVKCGGAAASYTASFDKAVYSQGDIAKLTIAFKDSKGVPSNSIDAVSAGTNQVITANQTDRVTAHAAAATVDVNGNLVYTFTIGTSSGAIAGKYQAIVSFPTVATGTTQTVAYEVTSPSGVVSNADVLKSIVALIASINKQIQALQKLILKR